MQLSLVLLFFARIRFSVGFFPELIYNHPVHVPQDSLEGYRNVQEHFGEKEGRGCRQPMEESEKEGMKLMVRLKRMAECH